MLHGAAEVIEGKIQSKVAEFLGLKSKLISQTYSDNPSIKQRAQGLLVEQNKLEKDMKIALANIDKIKAGAYTISDITKIGFFANDMSDHISASNRFLAGLPPAKGGTMAKVGLAIAGLFGITYMLKRN